VDSKSRGDERPEPADAVRSAGQGLPAGHSHWNARTMAAWVGKRDAANRPYRSRNAHRNYRKRRGLLRKLRRLLECHCTNP
jgi:hypothetical protein